MTDVAFGALSRHATAITHESDGTGLRSNCLGYHLGVSSAQCGEERPGTNWDCSRPPDDFCSGAVTALTGPGFVSSRQSDRVPAPGVPTAQKRRARDEAGSRKERVRWG